ncbi:arsenic resistance N-acetyltransferase ArsN2 [Flavisphingomonas formosensis]|uniref:arsenic resistance N-acetyltransferase ArsN2 n=1 Tax=Flavisphingomonas formosensis TaxID=861534 RepID=UPI0012FA56B9|nr:arsenic resistance N-acetyltransferase ArsN2 [Sphingomonas formosensis]
MSRVTLSPLPVGSYDVFQLALDAARLPTDDLMEADRQFFELSDEAGPIGFIGLEGTGADRLLRSLVVLPSRKCQRYGGLLVAHVETFARQEGVERLHLLTQTVPDFFRLRGYRPAERGSAPSAIKATAQFSAVCPASASYLVKDIA